MRTRATQFALPSRTRPHASPFLSLRVANLEMLGTSDLEGVLISSFCDLFSAFCISFSGLNVELENRKNGSAEVPK